MRDLGSDLRYALRILRKSPLFTCTAVISLALGIGANTTIFTLINALLLRELPVHRPERLVQLSVRRADGTVPFSYPMFRELERGQRVFSDLIGWTWATFTAQMNGTASRARVAAVTGNYYSALGVRPLLGRLLIPEDLSPPGGGTSQVAVMSYEFCQRHFGALENAIGKQIRIDTESFTVVGVTQKWFTGMTPGLPPDLTIPVTAYPLIEDDIKLDSRSILWVSVAGRLKDGVSLPQARAQLQSIWPAVLLATASTDTPGPRRQTFFSMGLEVSSAATGIAKDMRAHFSRPLYALGGIVGLILLVACTNLATLLLARSAARLHEMSVRMAIGASRCVLVRQILTESLFLSLVGAMVGIVFSFWGSRVLVRLMTEGSFTPVVLDLHPDFRVLSLTAGVALLTGVFIALIPGWRSSRQDPASVLQQGSRNLSAATGNLGRALIITQVVLSLVLLLSAGLLVRTFQRLHSIDLGFVRDNLLEVGLNQVPAGYRNLDMNVYHRELTQRIATIPGVRSVSLGGSFLGDSWKQAVSSQPVNPALATVIASQMMVWPSFFDTLGIRLIRGRAFDPTDDDHHPRVVVVSKTLAERLFPGEDAIGKSVRFGFMPEFQNLQIVGVADNARVFDLRDASPSIIYFCYLQFPAESQYGTLYVRTSQPPDTLAKSISRAVEALGHEYVLGTRTVPQKIDHQLVAERVTAMLSAFFAGLALLLASIGLYGLMSYSVTRRTREIGIRVALGAQRRRVLWMVVRETAALALIGIALGTPCALAATRLIATMLFGVSPNDGITIAFVSVLLVSVALVSGYLPARRGSRIDPFVALRCD